MSQQPNSQVSEEMDDSNDFFSLVFEDCHRRDTFPKVLKHPAIADVSALKRCSYSESDGAKVWGQCGVTMEDIKREIAGGRQKISSMTRSLCSPKKHVIFADDLGLELTSVKVFTKPQNETSQSYRHKVRISSLFFLISPIIIKTSLISYFKLKNFLLSCLLKHSFMLS